VELVAATSPPRLRWPGAAWLAAFGAIPALAVLIGVGLGGERATIALADVASVLTAVGGGAVLLRAGRRSPDGGRPWLLLGAAMLLWGLGEVLWGFHEVVQHDEVPFPSIADVAYLAAVPFALAGVLAFARGSGAGFQLRTVLDGCLVAASLLFASWALVLGPLFAQGSDSTLEQAVSIAYPLTDLVLAVLALLIVQWGNTAERVAIRIVAAGLLVMALTDSAFTWMTMDGSYSSSQPIVMLWPLSYLLLAVAASYRRGEDRRAVPRAQELGSMLTPYLPLVLALAVAVPRAVGDGLGPFLSVNGAIIVVVVLLRQAVLAIDLRTTVRSLHERERQLERLAHQDSLTGLANRASFGRCLEQAVEAGHEPTVVYIDLDGFKQVNDSFGHAAGDELLIEVARRLEACMDPSMMLARLGGDEFVVLVDGSHETAVEVARQILESFEVPFQHAGETVAFQASLGIATAPAGASPDEAVRRADAAMYVAKASGKGRAVDYPDEELLERLTSSDDGDAA
jgi:diguanylate cyclase (GGDEF)-like protein